MITPKGPLGSSYIPIFDGPEETKFLIDRGIEDGEFYFGNGTRDQNSPRVRNSISGFEKIREFIKMETESIEL